MTDDFEDTEDNSWVDEPLRIPPLASYPMILVGEKAYKEIQQELQELQEYQDYLADIWESYLGRSESRQHWELEGYLTYNQWQLDENICQQAYEARKAKDASD